LGFGFGPGFFFTALAVPFFGPGFFLSTAGGGGGAGLVAFLADGGAGVPWSEEGAAEGVFLARPSLLIFSAIPIESLSPPGVTSRELDGSCLIYGFYIISTQKLEYSRYH
jgi:hypothetical protein